MSDSDSDSESNAAPELPVPRIKGPSRTLTLSNKIEIGNDPSLLPYSGVAGYQQAFKKFSKSQVELPAPWFSPKITQHQCKPYQPYNKHIYDIATGRVPCDLMHMVPESYDPANTKTTYHFPCRCKEIVCYTPPPSLSLDSDYKKSTSCLDVRDNKESTTAWVWDINTQYAKLGRLNYVWGQCIFSVPSKSTVFRGTRSKKRRKKFTLSYRKRDCYKIRYNLAPEHYERMDKILDGE